MTESVPEHFNLQLCKTGSKDLTSHEDENGVSIAEAMCAYVLEPERLDDATRPEGSVRAYVELHIEQGRVLENEDLRPGS